MQKITVFLLFLLSVTLLTNCGSTQNTTAKNIVNTATDLVFPVEKDIQLGLQSVEQIKASPTEYPLLDEQKYAYAYQELRRMMQEILNSGKVQYKDKFTWQVYIIDNKETLNAFCLPGGYIYVYTGLINFLDNEAQLAGVLAHEIAHADHRHSAKQMIEQYGANVLLDLLIKKESVKQLAQIGSQLVTLKFSRNDEVEADASSVKYLYPTLYDARGAKYFFEKISNGSAKAGFFDEFMSTHPSPPNRIQNIENQWKELGGKVGNTFEERYSQLKNSLL